MANAFNSYGFAAYLTYKDTYTNTLFYISIHSTDKLLHTT